MPFERGAPKPLGSGRRKGTLNRITKEVAARLAELVEVTDRDNDPLANPRAEDEA